MMARVVIGIEMRTLLQIFLSSSFSISIFVSHFPMVDSDSLLEKRDAVTSKEDNIDAKE